MLLIEAGGKDNYHWIHIPVGYLYCIGNARTDWLYTTEPDAGLNGRSLRYPRGKTLGGCSSINGMIYMRGQARDYDQWASLTGDDAWRWQNALPYFKQHEDYYRGADEFHGAKPGNATLPGGGGGEWRVEKQRLRWDVLDAFARGGAAGRHTCHRRFQSRRQRRRRLFRGEPEERLALEHRQGLPPAHLPRPPQFHALDLGAGVAAGAREAARRFDALHRRGGVDRPGHGHGACGTRGHPQRRQHRLAADPAAVGHRPGRHCSAATACRCRWTWPGSAANLQDHLQIRAVFKLNNAKTLNTMVGNLAGKALVALEYALKRTGPMSMAPSQLGAFTRSSPDKPYPDLEYHVQPLSLDAFGEPLHVFNAFTASVCNLNPTSRGSVTIRSPRFQDAPAIAPNYLSTQGRPGRGGSVVAHHPAHRRAAGHGAVRARGMEAGRAVPERRGTGQAGR